MKSFSWGAKKSSNDAEKIEMPKPFFIQRSDIASEK